MKTKKSVLHYFRSSWWFYDRCIQLGLKISPNDDIYESIEKIMNNFTLLSDLEHGIIH
jgi:hypothetical protein